MWAAGALRGSPASTTMTERRWRASCRAAARPAAEPPIDGDVAVALDGAWSVFTHDVDDTISVLRSQVILRNSQDRQDRRMRWLRWPS